MCLAFQIDEVRSQLKAAINNSHPPSAKYLVEAAAACLDIGLQAAPAGISLKPVAWGLMAKAIKSNCSAVNNEPNNLRSSIGQKYFKLLGTSSSGQPELVAPKLDSLITGDHHAAVAHLLAGIHHTGVAKHPDQSSTASAQATITQQTSFLNAKEHQQNVAVTLQACSLMLCCCTIVASDAPGSAGLTTCIDDLHDLAGCMCILKPHAKKPASGFNQGLPCHAVNSCKLRDNP